MFCIFCVKHSINPKIMACNQHLNVFIFLRKSIANLIKFHNKTIKSSDILLWVDNIEKSFLTNPRVVCYFLNWISNNKDVVKTWTLEKNQDMDTIDNIFDFYFKNEDLDEEASKTYKSYYYFIEKKKIKYDEANSKATLFHRKKLIKDNIDIDNITEYLDDFNELMNTRHYLIKYSFLYFFEEFFKKEVGYSTTIKNYSLSMLKPVEYISSVPNPFGCISIYKELDEAKESIHFNSEDHHIEELNKDFLESEKKFDEVSKEYEYYLEMLKNLVFKIANM